MFPIVGLVNEWRYLVKSDIFIQTCINRIPPSPKKREEKRKDDDDEEELPKKFQRIFLEWLIWYFRWTYPEIKGLEFGHIVLWSSVYWPCSSILLLWVIYVVRRTTLGIKVSRGCLAGSENWRSPCSTGQVSWLVILQINNHGPFLMLNWLFIHSDIHVYRSLREVYVSSNPHEKWIVVIWLYICILSSMFCGQLMLASNAHCCPRLQHHWTWLRRQRYRSWVLRVLGILICNFLYLSSNLWLTDLHSDSVNTTLFWCLLLAKLFLSRCSVFLLCKSLEAEQ